jgi:exportin-5
LYSRSNAEAEDIQQLVHLMYTTEYLVVLQKLYEWSVVGPDDVDDTKYTISKKLSEVCTTKALSCGGLISAW